MPLRQVFEGDLAGMIAHLSQVRDEKRADADASRLTSRASMLLSEAAGLEEAIRALSNWTITAPAADGKPVPSGTGS
jgi:hypothetical protein